MVIPVDTTNLKNTDIRRHINVKKNCRHVAKCKLAEEFRHSREYEWGERRRGKYEHDEKFMGTRSYNSTTE
jgi:hypothetical protein